MPPEAKRIEGDPRRPGDDLRQTIESGEPAIEGRQPGRPDDAERDVEGAGKDPDHRSNDGVLGEDWESGRHQAV